MTSETAQQLEEFFRAFAGAAKPLLLLDYDGTLARFRVDRFKARPWAAVQRLLTRIQDQGRTKMVVVTGRPAGEIATLLGVEPTPEVWGLHGAERLQTNGQRTIDEPLPASQAKLDALRRQLRVDALGGLFEEKPNAVVMHWRGAAPGKARAIEKRTRALFEPIARLNGLSLLEFEAGLELRAGRDKGGAVHALLEEFNDGASHPAAYLGDDLTDEAAFRAIKGSGLSVLVRKKYRETAADVWLRPPEELREFLKKWLRACESLASH